MAIIKGGSNGEVAEVDAKKRLTVFSVAEPEDKSLNKEGKSWSIYFTVLPTAANDLFFYLKNTGTKDLFVTDIRISSTVVTTLYYRRVTGTASSGTDSTVTSRKLGNTTSPTATIQHDPDFTGLTSGGILFFEEVSIANTRFNLKTTSNIIIPQGQALAFERVAATGTIECAVSLAEAE